MRQIAFQGRSRRADATSGRAAEAFARRTRARARAFHSITPEGAAVTDEPRPRVDELNILSGRPHHVRRRPLAGVDASPFIHVSEEALTLAVGRQGLRLQAVDVKGAQVTAVDADQVKATLASAVRAGGNDQGRFRARRL